jgi:hypothetical protein
MCTAGVHTMPCRHVVNAGTVLQHCLVGDLDPCAPQVFGQAAWEQSARKYFRFLHFTTEDARAASPAVLRFSFNLPPIGKVPLSELWTPSQPPGSWDPALGSWNVMSHHHTTASSINAGACCKCAGPSVPARQAHRTVRAPLRSQLWAC